MGHRGREYKALFGEIPGETLAGTARGQAGRLGRARSRQTPWQRLPGEAPADFQR